MFCTSATAQSEFRYIPQLALCSPPVPEHPGLPEFTGSSALMWGDRCYPYRLQHERKELHC